jgi:hypothetical protein
MAEVMQRYRVQTGRKNGDKVARPTGGSKLLNNTGETAVPGKYDHVSIAACSESPAYPLSICSPQGDLGMSLRIGG